MKTKQLILTIIIITLCQNHFSQEISTEYTTKDINSALELLGLNFFKVDFSVAEKDYPIIIYINEYSSDSLISTQTCSFDPTFLEINQLNEIKIFAKRETFESGILWMDIKHPTQYELRRFDINEEFRITHFWRRFENADLQYGKQIPLLLYGTAWEVTLSNGVTLMKFCSDDLKRDMSNEAFKRMNHYYIIGYELKRKTK